MKNLMDFRKTIETGVDHAWEQQEDNSMDNICYLENILQHCTTLYLLSLLMNMHYWRWS